jgi:hypothetical protein
VQSLLGLSPHNLSLYRPRNRQNSCHFLVFVFSASPRYFLRQKSLNPETQTPGVSKNTGCLAFLEVTDRLGRHYRHGSCHGSRRHNNPMVDRGYGPQNLGEAGNFAAVVDPEFPLDDRLLIPHALVEDQGAAGVGDRSVEGAGGQLQNVAVGFEANDVVGLVPAEIDEVKGAATG